MKDNDTATYLALYMDTMLTKGSHHNMTKDADWLQSMRHVIILYTLLESKDLFLGTYTNFFRYRLLEDKSIGEDQEKAFVQLLKEEGAEQTMI